MTRHNSRGGDESKKKGEDEDDNKIGQRKRTTDLKGCRGGLDSCRIENHAERVKTPTKNARHRGGRV